METEKSRKTTYPNLRDLPGMNVTEILTEMPDGTEETGYFVPYKDANNIKSMMSKIKAKTGFLFSSKVVEDGILVWKESNINQPAA